MSSAEKHENGDGQEEGMLPLSGPHMMTSYLSSVTKISETAYLELTPLFETRSYVSEAVLELPM